MYDPEPRCFACHETGHVKADCPNRTPRTKTPPGAPADAGAGSTENRNAGVPPRRPPDQVADGHAWANRIRLGDPRLGRQHCGCDDDVVTSEFRRTAGLHPVHECELRQLAAEQIARAA